MWVAIHKHAHWRQLTACRAHQILEKPVAAGDTIGDQAALSLTVASQHLRVDLCADAATAPDAVPEERPTYRMPQLVLS